MPTVHPRVMKAHEDCPTSEELWRQFGVLGAALESSDVPLLKVVLKQMLAGYQPHADVVDWVHMERHRIRDIGSPCVTERFVNAAISMPPIVASA